jgi:hypothetical protein
MLREVWEEQHALAAACIDRIEDEGMRSSARGRLALLGEVGLSGGVTVLYSTVCSAVLPCSAVLHVQLVPCCGQILAESVDTLTMARADSAWLCYRLLMLDIKPFLGSMSTETTPQASVRDVHESTVVDYSADHGGHRDGDDGDDDGVSVHVSEGGGSPKASVVSRQLKRDVSAALKSWGMAGGDVSTPT